MYIKTINDMKDLHKEYKLTGKYSQTSDGADMGDEGYQFLEIATDDCGGGPFFILKTERWAFDDPGELLDIINEFVEKHGRIQQDETKEKED